jgi:lipid II:glycine glycyltransferase (peptidoglycan interpeptide bridge formation enzyme)
VLDLRVGFEEVWSAHVTAEARSNVRRAERLGVEVTCGADERHRSAYRLLLERSRQRWADQHREPAILARWRAERSDPWARIDAMIRCTEVCRLWIAWHDGAPAAAIIVTLGRNAHYTRGVMDRELAGTTRANDLLQRTAIEHACAIGCDWYHMGESGRSRSLARFKERFGARPHDYTEYILERVPLHTAEQWCRSGVKRAIGYRDA